MTGSFSPSTDISQDPTTNSTQSSLQSFPDTKVILTWVEDTGPTDGKIKSYCTRC